VYASQVVTAPVCDVCQNSFNEKANRVIPLTADKLEKNCFELARPLLIVIKANGGILGCGYLRTETFNKTGEVFALLTALRNYDKMRATSMLSISDEAARIGASIGDTGREAIAKMQAIEGASIC
jgi:uncharacterized protein YunC (DUF1805 family)